MDPLFEALPSLTALGIPGLVIFGILAVVYGIGKFWDGMAAYKKQVSEAEQNAAQSAIESNEALDDTDAMGDSFLNGD